MKFFSLETYFYFFTPMMQVTQPPSMIPADPSQTSRYQSESVERITEQNSGYSGYYITEKK